MRIDDDDRLTTIAHQGADTFNLTVTGRRSCKSQTVSMTFCRLIEAIDELSLKSLSREI